MIRSLRSALLVLASSLVLPAIAHAQEIKWREWNAGMREAAASNRPVLVDVYTDWCTWCKRMDKDVYSRPDVREYLSKRYVTVKLNAERGDAANYEGKSYTSRTLASRFRVTGYPTTVFLRSAGDHIANVPGYVPPDRFLLLLQYVGEGHLDRGVPFEEFAKKAGADH
jgi:thioredoxin-related protein